jgi:radical SAM protein with 4Fe4S-binding SPASM domain
MTDEIASDIRDRGNIRLCSSLDGPRSVHDAQRIYPDGQGTYSDVIRWTGRLREDYSIDVPFLLTMTTNGIGQEREIVEEYSRHELSSVYFRWVNAVGRAHRNGDALCVSPAHAVSAWKTMLDAALEKNRAGQTFVEQQTAYLLSNMLNARHSFMCMRRPCGCGVSQVVIGPDGSIHGCDGGRSVSMLTLGNVLSDTYDEVYTSATARALRTLASETLPHCQECAFGAYCGYCVARGINQHGGPIPDIPADSECRIYREIIPYLFTKLLDRNTAIALNRWL